jgi:2-oxoglutarate ferredoxin oxidoreductase subunit beta
MNQITWCPGCGNYGIFAALKAAIEKSGIPLSQFVVVYGVGCHGNMASTIKLYGVHALHGRAIPVAEGIKLANHKLKVIVVTGDGDMLGEGLSHFINACRGNHDLTLILHNNQVYGLTTGQTSPTSLKETRSKTVPLGVINEPINAIQTALLMGASHVSRGFAAEIPKLTEMIDRSIKHTGLSLVEVLQPCVTFNKINTYDWFRNRIKPLTVPEESRFGAMAKAVWTEESIFTGEIYKDEKKSFHETWPQIKEQTLIQNIQENDIAGIMEIFR